MSAEQHDNHTPSGSAGVPDVDTLVARVKDRSALLADWADESADGDDVDQVRGELIDALSDLAATARQGIEDSERFHRHVETMIEPKVLAEADRLARRVAELEAAPDLREPLRELAGYVRAHLAGQDADPELKWALEQADEALAEDGGGA